MQGAKIVMTTLITLGFIFMAIQDALQAHYGWVVGDVLCALGFFVITIIHCKDPRV